MTEPQDTQPGRVPLQYADPSVRSSERERLEVLVAQAGGYRQILLSLGLASALGGFAYGVSGSGGRETAATFAAIGGGLIGLAVPVSRRRGPPQP